MKRNSREISHWLLYSAVLFIAGCGTPGAPQPPSLRLPKPVDNLEAVRKGDRVFLRWREPGETTDRQGIRSPITMRVCRSYRTKAQESCKDVVADLRSDGQPAGKPMQQVDDLTSLLRTNTGQDFVTYNVEVMNNRGKSAGPSNEVTVFLAPSLPPVTGLTASLPRRDEILLQWTAPALPTSQTLKTDYLYKIQRSTEGAIAKPSTGKTGAGVILSSLPAKQGITAYGDKSFQWESTYDYRVIGVTQVFSRDGKLLAEFEGEDSPVVRITVHDIFPPEVPRGVQAVFTALADRKFIDLTWSPSEDTDLAGYHVYRREEGLKPVRLDKDLLKTPTFRDEQVASGKTYFYTVTAVDMRGNESKPSDEAKENVPQ